MNIRFLLFFSFFTPLTALAVDSARNPRIAGSWTELRKAPVFDSDIQEISQNAASVLPVGVEFRVEKTYGRWFYGSSPGSKRKGWVYNRSMLPAGDTSTLSEEQRRLVLNTGHHSKILSAHLGVDPKILRHLNLIEATVLGKKIFQTFRTHREQANISFSLFPMAYAESTDDKLGLSGLDLQFLDSEAASVRKQKDAKAAALLIKERKKWKVSAISPDVQARLIGRFLLAKENALPALSHEEIDINLYFRAITQIALEGCQPKIQNFWRLRAWQPIRSQLPQTKYVSGGYVLLGAEELSMIANEAELAYVLLRPLVALARMGEISRPIQGQKSNWWKNIPAYASQNPTGIKSAPDASDEIEIDLATTACLSRAGYSHETGLKWIRKLIAAKRDGLEYRSGRLQSLLKEALGSGEVLSATVTNEKRFLQAERLWKDK